jgi:hypothetical protein
MGSTFARVVHRGHAMARPSPKLLLLALVWAILGVRVVLAGVHREAFSGDILTLELFAFVVATAILGSRVWLAFDTWRHPPSTAHPT